MLDVRAKKLLRIKADSATLAFLLGCTFKFYRTKEVTDPNAALEVVSGHYFRYLNPLKENTKWACQIVPSTSAYQDCTGNWLASANGWARFEISVETGTGYFSFKVSFLIFSLTLFTM